MLTAGEDSVAVIRKSVEEMLAAFKIVAPGKRFASDHIGFKNDLHQSKIRKILIRVIENEHVTSELRAQCVRLMYWMGLVCANAEDLLRCAVYL